MLTTACGAAKEARFIDGPCDRSTNNVLVLPRATISARAISQRQLSDWESQFVQKASGFGTSNTSYLIRPCAHSLARLSRTEPAHLRVVSTRHRVCVRFIYLFIRIITHQGCLASHKRMLLTGDNYKNFKCPYVYVLAQDVIFNSPAVILIPHC